MVPDDKKRDKIRFDIRMKMFKQSGIVFPSTMEALDKKKAAKFKAPVRLGPKPTEVKEAELNKHIKLTLEGDI